MTHGFIATGLLVLLLSPVVVDTSNAQNVPHLGSLRPISGADGVEVVFIPAGHVDLGSPENEIDQLIANCHKGGGGLYICEEQLDAESPRTRMEVNGFELDKTEVTNAQFERFVQATGYRTTADVEGSSIVIREKNGKWVADQQNDRSWRRPSETVTIALPTHPVVHVTWNDAVAYCKWMGKRLPTEAEWEYAARGPVGRTYPWGHRWESGNARHVGNREGETTAPVGSYPSGASPLGVVDLSGNVSEWTSSLFRPYPYAPTDGRESTATPGRRTLRGGDWSGGSRDLRAARRFGVFPTTRNNLIGFRCVRTP